MKMKKVILIGLLILLVSGCVEFNNNECKEIAETEWGFNNSDCLRIHESSCCCTEIIEKKNSFKKLPRTELCFDLK